MRHLIDRLRNALLIGYLRVSISDGSQSGDLQRDALAAAGVEPAQIYEERVSGRLDVRPGLEAALKALRPGDALVVWKLDRLGRNLRHLVNTVHELTKRDVGFEVLSGQGAALSTKRTSRCSTGSASRLIRAGSISEPSALRCGA